MNIRNADQPFQQYSAINFPLLLRKEENTMSILSYHKSISFLGATGSQGLIGATGPRGSPGGATGFTGPPGWPGSPGGMGHTGYTGSPGPRGEAGPPGYAATLPPHVLNEIQDSQLKTGESYLSCHSLD